MKCSCAFVETGKPRSLARFQRIAAYLKIRRAREKRQDDIEKAWAKIRGDRLLLRLARLQLQDKYDKQNGMCFYCEKPAWLGPARDFTSDTADFETLRMNRRRKMAQATREHLVRFADGGSDDDENIVMACSDCNSRRGDRTVDEWKAMRIEREQP